MTGALLIDRALDLNTFEAAGRAARRKRVREAIALALWEVFKERRVVEYVVLGRSIGRPLFQSSGYGSNEIKSHLRLELGSSNLLYCEWSETSGKTRVKRISTIIFLFLFCTPLHVIERRHELRRGIVSTYGKISFLSDKLSPSQQYSIVGPVLKKMTLFVLMTGSVYDVLAPCRGKSHYTGKTLYSQRLSRYIRTCRG
jgi:hypothetical protein